MKKVISILAVVLVTTSMVFAQSNSRGNSKGKGKGKAQSASQQQNKAAKLDAMATRRADKMKEVVGLSDDQYVKVKQVFTDFNAKERAVRTEGTEPTQAQKDQMKAYGKQRSEAIKAILTPEQMQKWKAHQQENAQNHENHDEDNHEGHGHGEHGNQGGHGNHGKPAEKPNKGNE